MLTAALLFNFEHVLRDLRGGLILVIWLKCTELLSLCIYSITQSWWSACRSAPHTALQSPCFHFKALRDVARCERCCVNAHLFLSRIRIHYVLLLLFSVGLHHTQEPKWRGDRKKFFHILFIRGRSGVYLRREHTCCFCSAPQWQQSQQVGLKTIQMIWLVSRICSVVIIYCTEKWFMSKARKGSAPQIMLG